MNVLELPVPDGSELNGRVQAMIDAWPTYEARLRYPRSKWLHDLEEILQDAYPLASSENLTYTARLLAPFALELPGTP